MLVVLISLTGCRVAGMEAGMETPKKSNGESKGDDCDDFFSTLTNLWANLKRAGAAVIVPLSGPKSYVKPVAEMLQNEPKSIIQRFYVEGATNDESGRGAPRFFHPGITKLPLIIVTSPTSAAAQKGDGSRSEYQRMWDEADNAFGKVFDPALEKRENVYIISCRPKMGEDDGKYNERISTTGFGWLRYCAMDIARRLNVWSAGNLKYVWFSDMNVLGFVRQKQVPVSFKYVKRRVKSLELPSSIVKQLCTLRILQRNLQEFTKVYTPNDILFSVIERIPEISPIQKKIAKFIRETKDELENMIAIATRRVSSIRLFVVPDGEGAEASELMFPKIANAGTDFPHDDPLFNSCGCKDLIPDILAEEANFSALREVFKSEPEAGATATTEKDSLHKCIFEDALLKGRVVRVSLTGLAGGLKGVEYSIVAESEDMDMTDQIIQDTIEEEDVVLLTGLTGTTNGEFDGHVILGLYSDVRVEHDLAMTKDGAAFGRLDLEVREIFEKHPGTVVLGFRADVFGRDEKNLRALHLAAKSKDTYHTHSFGKSKPLGYEQYNNENHALHDVIRHPQTIQLLQQVTVWRMADVGSVNFPCGMTRGKEDFSLFDFLKDLHRAHKGNDGPFGTLMIKLVSVSIVKLASPRDTASSPSDRMREMEAVKTWYKDHGGEVSNTSMTAESFVGDALGLITSTLQIFCDGNAQDCGLTAEDVVMRWVRSGKMALDERAPSAEDSDMKSSTPHLRGSDDDSNEEEGGKGATARAARKSPSTGRKEDFRAVAGKIVVNVVSACLRLSGFATERAKRGMTERGVRSRYAFEMFYSNEYAKPDYDSMPPPFLGDKQADNLALVDSELFVMLTERERERSGDAKHDAKKTKPEDVDELATKLASKDVPPAEGHPSDVEAFVRAARSGEREKVVEIMDQMQDRTIKGVMDAIASDGRNPLTAAAIANKDAIVKYVLGELRVDVLKRKASDIADTLCASMSSPPLVGHLTEKSAVEQCTKEIETAGTSEIWQGYPTIEKFCQEQFRLMQIKEGEMKILSEAARQNKKRTLKASKEVIDPPVTFIPATVHGPPSEYELMRVPGDGDCMYYAILEAAYDAGLENGDFKERPANKTDAGELRTKIANYFVDPESMSKCPTIQVIKELLGADETETATGLFERRVRPYIAGSDINVGSYGGQEEQLLIECMYRQNPLPGNRSLRIEVFDGAHNEWFRPPRDYETLLLMAFRRGGSECMKMVRTAYCKSEREEERGEEEVSNDEEEEKVSDDDGVKENESGSYEVDIKSQIHCRCDKESISICPVYHTFPRGEDSPFPSTEEDVPPTCAEYSYNNADSQPLATYCDVSPRDTWSVGGSFESAVFFKRDESERKMTILQSAVVSGNLRLLDLIMSMSDVQDIDTLTKYDRDGDDRTSMIYAAASGSFKAVLRIHEFLKYQMSRAVGLKKYYDHVDKFGRNAMHYAADQADLLGHSDPYVVAQFLDMRPGLKQSRRVEKKYPELKRFRQRTRVIQNEPDPVWKEIFVMNEVPSEFVLLRLEVFDKDKIGRDTFLGRVDTQLGYWDRKARRWRSRFDNVDIPEGERLFFPVVRKEAVLRTRSTFSLDIRDRNRRNVFHWIASCGSEKSYDRMVSDIAAAEARAEGAEGIDLQKQQRTRQCEAFERCMTERDIFGLRPADHAWLCRRTLETRATSSSSSLFEHMLKDSKIYFRREKAPTEADVRRRCVRVLRALHESGQSEQIMTSIFGKKRTKMTVDRKDVADRTQQKKAQQHPFWSKQPMVRKRGGPTTSVLSSSVAATSSSTLRVRRMDMDTARKIGAIPDAKSLPTPPGLIWARGSSSGSSSSSDGTDNDDDGAITLDELVRLLNETECDDATASSASPRERDFLAALLAGDDSSRTLEPSIGLWTYKLSIAVDPSECVLWRGFRDRKDKRLVAFIAGTPMRVSGRVFGRRGGDACPERVLEIHSLFVHPSLRGKRLTPLLVQSMVLQGIRMGLQHAIHTHRKHLPVGTPPIATLTYFTRPIRPMRLLVGGGGGGSGRLRPRTATSFETRADVVLRFDAGVVVGSVGADARPFHVRRLSGLADATRAHRLVSERGDAYELAGVARSVEEFRRRYLPDAVDEVRSFGVFDDDVGEEAEEEDTNDLSCRRDRERL
eukprot:g3267.t1